MKMAHFRPKQLAHIEPKWVAQLRPFYPVKTEFQKGNKNLQFLQVKQCGQSFALNVE